VALCGSEAQPSPHRAAKPVMRECSGSPQKVVANLWTEFAAHGGEPLIMNGKEPQNPNKLVVAATFEMAKT